MKEVARKMIFPQFLRNLHDVLRNLGAMLQSRKRKKEKEKKKKKKRNDFAIENGAMMQLS